MCESVHLQRSLSFLCLLDLVRVTHQGLVVIYEACVYGGAKSPESRQPHGCPYASGVDYRCCRVSRFA